MVSLHDDQLSPIANTQTDNIEGVLWSGDSVYEGVPETIALLKSKGRYPKL